jgi:hypothetical protein
VQNAHLPFFSDGPLPVSSTQPTSLEVRACSSTRSSSSTVCGRNALSTSGRSKAIRTVPWARARWYGEVGQVLEAGDVVPGVRVERLRDTLDGGHEGDASGR